MRGAVMSLHSAFSWLPMPGRHCLSPSLTAWSYPVVVKCIATAPAPRLIDRSCYCDDGFEYFQQLPDGRLVLGGYRNLAIEQETTYADHTTPLIQDALSGLFGRHFPEVADQPVERRWSGTMAFTSRWSTARGRLRRDDRIAFAVGFNGHGLGLGMMVVEALLRELDGGRRELLQCASVDAGSSLSSPLLNCRIDCCRDLLDRIDAIVHRWILRGKNRNRVILARCMDTPMLWTPQPSLSGYQPFFSATSVPFATPAEMPQA